VLSLSPAIRIFVHALPTDMRKHFDGLCAIVTQTFGMDVLRGDYFVFLNRCRDRCKILFWDHDGLVVWAKRLERGRFQLPGGRDTASLVIEVDAVTLAMIIGGVDLDTAKRRKRYHRRCRLSKAASTISAWWRRWQR
jgi:transposase